MSIKNLLIVVTIGVTILMVTVLCLCFPGCNKPEEHQVQHHSVEKVADPAPPNPPPSPATNPFERPSPAPVHDPIQVSHWDMVGDAFKMNDNWYLYTWRDSANHNICYFYNVMGGADNKAVIGHGMSCVKE